MGGYSRINHSDKGTWDDGTLLISFIPTTLHRHHSIRCSTKRDIQIKTRHNIQCLFPSTTLLPLLDPTFYDSILIHGGVIITSSVFKEDIFVQIPGIAPVHAALKIFQRFSRKEGSPDPHLTPRRIYLVRFSPFSHCTIRYPQPESKKQFIFLSYPPTKSIMGIRDHLLSQPASFAKRKEYTFGPTLGQGTYGKVQRATWHKAPPPGLSDREVALK